MQLNDGAGQSPMRDVIDIMATANTDRRRAATAGASVTTLAHEKRVRVDGMRDHASPEEE